MFEIVAAHGISYAATASVGYLPDFMKKLKRQPPLEVPNTSMLSLHVQPVGELKQRIVSKLQKRLSIVVYGT